MTEPTLNEPPLPLFEGQEFILTGSKGRLPSYITNHRQRLRDRFTAAGTTALPDYELLELVLFRSLPRCDVKPVASRLLEAFGDFNRALLAPTARLTDVRGVGPAVASDLKLIEAAAHRMAQARILQSPVLSSWDALLDYCRTAMSHLETEQFRVLFSSTVRTSSLRTRRRQKARSTTCRSIRARSSNALWNSTLRR